MRWFHTGDIGQFHADGCLEIIDRKKDIVKLQHGEYVSLGKVHNKTSESVSLEAFRLWNQTTDSFHTQVETALVVSPYVDNIMVHANSFHSYCVALVVASQHTLEAWASKQGIQYSDFADLCQKQEALKEVSGSLLKVLNPHIRA